MGAVRTTKISDKMSKTYKVQLCNWDYRAWR